MLFFAWKQSFHGLKDHDPSNPEGVLGLASEFLWQGWSMTPWAQKKCMEGWIMSDPFFDPTKFGSFMWREWCAAWIHRFLLILSPFSIFCFQWFYGEAVLLGLAVVAMVPCAHRVGVDWKEFFGLQGSVGVKLSQICINVSDIFHESITCVEYSKIIYRILVNIRILEIKYSIV